MAWMCARAPTGRVDVWLQRSALQRTPMGKPQRCQRLRTMELQEDITSTRTSNARSSKSALRRSSQCGVTEDLADTWIVLPWTTGEGGIGVAEATAAALLRVTLVDATILTAFARVLLDLVPAATLALDGVVPAVVMVELPASEPVVFLGGMIFRYRCTQRKQREGQSLRMQNSLRQLTRKLRKR